MRNFQCLWPVNMLSSGKFAKRNCNAWLGFPSLAKYFFSSVPHALARTPLRRIKYLLINVFKNQVKLLLVVITACDIAQSSHFTGTRKVKFKNLISSGSISVRLYLSEYISQVYVYVTLFHTLVDERKTTIRDCYSLTNKF